MVRKDSKTIECAELIKSGGNVACKLYDEAVMAYWFYLRESERGGIYSADAKYAKGRFDGLIEALVISITARRGRFRDQGIRTDLKQHVINQAKRKEEQRKRFGVSQ